MQKFLRSGIIFRVKRREITIVPCQQYTLLLRSLSTLSGEEMDALPGVVIQRILSFAWWYPRTFDSRQRRIRDTIESFRRAWTFSDYTVSIASVETFTRPSLVKQMVSMPAQLRMHGLDLIEQMIATDDYVAGLCCAASMCATRRLLDSRQIAEARAMVAAARLASYRRDPQVLPLCALEDADAAIALDANCATAHACRGLSLCSLARRREARESIARALHLAETGSTLRFNLCNSLEIAISNFESDPIDSYIT